MILAVGARPAANEVRYLVDEAALRHGAGVEQETSDGREAYARFPPPEPTRYPDGSLP